MFIDEVEEIASRRGGEPPSPTQAVTNELLKVIPNFREKPGRLLICATNFIRALDPAFLRHGRFDYVIPIGLPDEEARHAIWQMFIPPTIRENLDIEPLVQATDGFSPADIEYAARSASQAAFERALANGHSAEDLAPTIGTTEGPSVDDYLSATLADQSHGLRRGCQGVRRRY